MPTEFDALPHASHGFFHVRFRLGSAAHLDESELDRVWPHIAHKACSHFSEWYSTLPLASLANAEPAKDAVQYVVGANGADDDSQLVQGGAHQGGNEIFLAWLLCQAACFQQ